MWINGRPASERSRKTTVRCSILEFTGLIGETIYKKAEGPSLEYKSCPSFRDSVNLIGCSVIWTDEWKPQHVILSMKSSICSTDKVLSKWDDGFRSYSLMISAFTGLYVLHDYWNAYGVLFKLKTNFSWYWHQPDSLKRWDWHNFFLSKVFNIRMQITRLSRLSRLSSMTDQRLPQVFEIWR